jgi:hypothetical protein
MHELSDTMISLATALAAPLFAMVLGGGLFAFLSFIFASILFIFNIVTVFLRPSRRIAGIFIVLSFLPFIIGIIGSLIGMAGFKYLMTIMKELDIETPKIYGMGSYISWFSIAVGVTGTVVNLIPAGLSFIFSRNRAANNDVV